MNPKITSQKIFNKTVTVLNSVQIETDTINKIPLESFITTNTQQILDIRKLNASVTFGNLFISGLYQGFNLVKLEEETIKTYGHQYVRAKLIFLDEPTVPAFRVTETLNEIDVEEFVSTSDDIKQLNAESFGRIEADSVTVFGNAFTDISNFDLDAFDSHRVSLTKHQLINASYSFEEVEVNAMKADFINGRAYDYLFETRSFAQEIANRLHAGQLHVKGRVFNHYRFLN